MTRTANILLWAIAFLIACGTFAGLFWLAALFDAHLFGISVHDALIRLLQA